MIVKKIGMKGSRGGDKPKQKWAGVIKGDMRECVVNVEMVMDRGMLRVEIRVADPIFVG